MRDCWAELRQADIKRSDSPSTMTGVDVWRSRRCLILFNTSEKWLMCDVMCWNCNGKGCDFHFPLGSSIGSKVMVLHWQEDTTLTIKIIQLQLLLNERKSIKSVSEQLSVALSQVQCLTKSEPKAAESRNKHWVFVKNNYVFNRQKAQVNNTMSSLTRLILIQQIQWCNPYLGTSLWRMFSVALKDVFFLKTGQRSPMFQVIVELEGRVSGSRKKVGKRQQGYDQNVGPRKESKRVQRDLLLSCWCSWLWYRLTWRAKGRTMQCGTRPEGGGLVREFWAVIVKNCLGKWGRQGDRQTAAGSRGEKGGDDGFFWFRSGRGCDPGLPLCRGGLPLCGCASCAFCALSWSCGGGAGNGELAGLEEQPKWKREVLKE